MNRFSFFHAVVILLLYLVTACSDDPDPISMEPDVLVVNEGNFLSNDGSLSGYRTATGDTSLALFSTVNGFQIAATIQSVFESTQYLFIICNAPDKIEVVNKSTLESVETIQPAPGAQVPLTAPFRMAIVGSKGYITNWGTFNGNTFEYENGFIAVLDIPTLTLESKTDWPHQPNDILALNASLFVSNVNDTTVSVVDPSSVTATSDIIVPPGPDKMVVDAAGDIWLICNSGNLVFIDPGSPANPDVFNDVPATGFNEKLVINPAGTDMYFLTSAFQPDFSTVNAVVHVPVLFPALPMDTLVTGTNYYGLGVNAANEVYVGDSKAFQTDGEVWRYSSTGTLLDNFACGRGPNGFIFR